MHEKHNVFPPYYIQHIITYLLTYKSDLILPAYQPTKVAINKFRN